MRGDEVDPKGPAKQKSRVISFENRAIKPSRAADDEGGLPRSTALERHFTVTEIAKRWGMSEKSVRRFFADEPGVLKWGSPETRKKRGYCNLRIPESVLIRVHQRRAS